MSDVEPSAAQLRSRRASAARWLARVSLAPYTGVIVGLVIVCVFLTATQPVFLTWANFRSVIGANTVILILAVGETFVIISGGIDLSTASATTATGMVLGLALEHGWSLVPALLVTLTFGLVIGLANGLLITKVKISFLVVTLGALSIWQSFALIVDSGGSIAVFGVSAFTPIGDLVNNGIGPISLLMIFDVLLVLLAGGILRVTTFGRAVFAVGSNDEAARLNGVNVSGVLIGVYALAGLAAGVAAVISVGRLTAAASQSDPNLLLEVLAAVLIGGTSFSGGEGGIFGTVVGVLFLGAVQNGLILSSVSAFWQGTVSGIILILAVGLSALRNRGWKLRRGAPAVRTL
jgi:ribose/xylose/arabinose/galactoside ABC-type transport system permease subunit